MDWIYALLISVVLMFLLAYRLSGGDILAPSVVMCAMFTLSTSVAIMGGGRMAGIEFSEKSFAILFIGILTFVLAESVFRCIFQRNVTQRGKRRQLEELSARPLLVANIQGWMIIAGILFDVFVIVWDIQSMISIAGGIGGTYREFAVHHTVTSWETTYTNPVLTQMIKLTQAMGYISGFVLIQHIVAKKGDFFKEFGLLALMILSQAPDLLGGARGGVLKFLVAIIVYYYILLHQMRGWNRDFSWKFVGIGALCVLIGAPLFYSALKWMGRDSSGTMLDQICGYVGYPIYSFDQYVKKPLEPIAFGEESLIGVNSFLSRFLGLDVYVRNTNLEFRQSNGVRFPNVYTFFRRPLHDFGLGGMLVFTALVALLFAWIYYSKIKWRTRTKGTDCWTLAYGYLFYWIVVSSIMQYSEIYVSFATVLYIAAIIIGYRLMTGLKVTIYRNQYYRRYRRTPSIVLKWGRHTVR